MPSKIISATVKTAARTARGRALLSAGRVLQCSGQGPARPRRRQRGSDPRLTHGPTRPQASSPVWGPARPAGVAAARPPPRESRRRPGRGGSPQGTVSRPVGAAARGPGASTRVSFEGRAATAARSLPSRRSAGRARALPAMRTVPCGARSRGSTTP